MNPTLTREFRHNHHEFIVEVEIRSTVSRYRMAMFTYGMRAETGMKSNAVATLVCPRCGDIFLIHDRPFEWEGIEPYTPHHISPLEMSATKSHA